MQEATLVFETHIPIPMIVVDGTGIEKGTAVQSTDPLTVSAVSASTNVAGGIIGSEKIASNGVTKANVYRGGIFKVYASGSVTNGDLLGADVDNDFYSLTAPQSITTSNARIWGISLESATDGETFLMELNIGGALQVA
ncbi:MAG: hypothetical protein WC711_04185 [Candidatus Staskawiczbacteria bacterium]|jgi:hypothetical protein